ncbi:integral membrane protein-like protein [Dendryphion nanum]|uniref:Efficient mitochondria targeting-associated protein 19 n=1 Tax=Dendryphion nanum TaxID=256645 RepID=A0A9P9DL75_9PLEO|nr:integral membrane protein-like protein [Dendryphion nanum]
MANSILSRKKDLIYLIFFITHVPVMLAFDLTHYYPAAIKPTWMDSVRTWYVATHGDRFFKPNPPAWFPLYTLLELTLHIPLTLWIIPQLISSRPSPRLPLALFFFSLEVSITTVTCMAEMLSWEELTPQQRGLQGLGGMYGGYLALAVFMGVDAWARLDQVICRAKGVEPITKKKL